MATPRLRLLALGDSLTEGYYNYGSEFHPYTRRLGELLGRGERTVRIVNAGVSGDIVTGPCMLQRLQKHLWNAHETNEHFHWVLIMAGINDIGGRQKNPAEVFEAYQALVHAAHQHGAHIFVMTLLEVIPQIGTPADQSRQEYNRLIREELIPQHPEKSIVIFDIARSFLY
jgi:lysophospholipase L1-like esterase